LLWKIRTDNGQTLFSQKRENGVSPYFPSYDRIAAESTLPPHPALPHEGGKERKLTQSLKWAIVTAGIENRIIETDERR
jgi:hypothetical protein